MCARAGQMAYVYNNDRHYSSWATAIGGNIVGLKVTKAAAMSGLLYLTSS